MSKSSINSISLTYGEMAFSATLLARAMIHGQESRSRNRIVNLLKDKVAEFNKERQELINKFGAKGKDGKLKETEGNYVIEDKKGFEKEINELVENFKGVFDILPSNRDDFISAKGTLDRVEIDMNYADEEMKKVISDKLGEI